MKYTTSTGVIYLKVYRVSLNVQVKRREQKRRPNEWEGEKERTDSNSQNTNGKWRGNRRGDAEP